MARDDQAPPTGPDDEVDAGFRQFYDEVLQALATPGDPADPVAAEQAAQQVQKHLRGVIELQELQARRQAGRAAAALAEPVRYLKAALADEILLQREWAGRGAWERCLLEARLFRSSVAGEKVFTEIERVLSEREPAQRPLARLYLFALALGFQGRWRGQPGAGGLQGLRAELYQFVYQRQPDPARPGPLVPQAYAHTLSHLAPSRRRPLGRGAVVWTLALLALLALSELLWLWPTWSLRQPAGAAVQEVTR